MPNFPPFVNGLVALVELELKLDIFESLNTTVIRPIVEAIANCEWSGGYPFLQNETLFLKCEDSQRGEAKKSELVEDVLNKQFCEKREVTESKSLSLDGNVERGKGLQQRQ